MADTVQERRDRDTAASHDLPPGGAARLLHLLWDRKAWWLVPVLLALLIAVGLTWLTSADPASKDADFALYTGLTLAKQGKLDLAIEHFNRVLEINPESADAHDCLGTVYFMQNKLDQAAARFSRAIQIDAGHYRAHTNLGFTLMRQNDLAGAEACFLDALTIAPDHPAARKGLMEVRGLLGPAP